jgi:biotin transport system substrate-specific component
MVIPQSVKASKVFTFISEYKIHIIISFAVLTAISAHVSIPVQPVPFTLQTLVVLLSGMILGSQKGAYAQILYLTLGLVGLPVFALNGNLMTGAMRLVGPTGGYLLAFPLAAYAAGAIFEYRKSFFATLSAFAAGEIVINIFGMLFLNTFYIHNLQKSFVLGASIFSVWTIAKIVIGMGIVRVYTKNKK